MKKIISKRYINDGKSWYKLNDIQKKAKQSVEEKIINGEYKFEKHICECGAGEESFVVLAEKDRYGLDVRTVICRNCGLLMTNPRMTQSSYNLFYDCEYRQLYMGIESAENLDDRFFEKKKATGREIMEFVESAQMSNIHNVLEIGCSAGGILESFKEKGYTVKGIDLGGEYVEYGKRRGLDLEQCSSTELLERNTKYDLIILNHVFEHFLDIQKELDTIRQLLNKDGALYVAVPGVFNINKPTGYEGDFLSFLQNAHVYHFTLHSLQKVMARYGWEMIKGNETIQSLFCINSDVEVDKNNDYSIIMRKLKRMELFRPITELVMKIRRYYISVFRMLSNKRRG